MPSNNKPSPNINYFAGYGSRNKKLNNFLCLNCPSNLNIKYTYTKEFEEAPDGTKARKLECKRCNAIGWTCEKCDTNFVYKTIKSLKLHNRRNHKKFGLKIGTNASDDVVENAEIMESVTTDGYFPDLQKEENWISFNNNLIHLRKEDRTFTTAMHESKADKYLVAYSQDKGYVDDDKLNNYPTNEVTLMIDITKLSANLKPKENQLLMKIVKGVKAVEQQ